MQLYAHRQHAEQWSTHHYPIPAPSAGIYLDTSGSGCIEKLTPLFRSSKLTYVGSSQYWRRWLCPDSVLHAGHLSQYVTSLPQLNSACEPCVGSRGEYQPYTVCSEWYLLVTGLQRRPKQSWDAMTQSAPISLTLSTNCPIANCRFILEWLRFFGKSPHKSLRIFLLNVNVKQCIEQIWIYILASQTLEQLISKVTSATTYACEWYFAGFHSVYLHLKLLSFVGQHNSFVYHKSRHNISYESISYMSTLYRINSNSQRRRVGWLLNRLFSSTIRSWVRQSGFLMSTIIPSHAATFSTRYWSTAALRSYYKLRSYLKYFINTSDASEFCLSTFNRF